MPEYMDNPTTPTRENALRDIARGKKSPFDGQEPNEDWARTAALGIFANFSDRRGLKHEIDSYDDDVKEELVATVAEIIRAAKDSA